MPGQKRTASDSITRTSFAQPRMLNNLPSDCLTFVDLIFVCKPPEFCSTVYRSWQQSGANSDLKSESPLIEVINVRWQKLSFLGLLREARVIQRANDRVIFRYLLHMVKQILGFSRCVVPKHACTCPPEAIYCAE